MYIDLLSSDPAAKASITCNMYTLLIPAYRIFGFLAGAVASGMCVWYYLLGDYRVSNEMLSEDISVRFSSPLLSS